MRKFNLDVRPSCSDLDALLADMGTVRQQAIDEGIGSAWYFRGDKADSKLKPTIARPKKYGGRQLEFSEDDERNLFHRFQRFAYGQLPPGAKKWDVLFLARHYGLPTRIFDWSVNPLVAIYFACTPLEHTAPAGVVWGILRQSSEEHDLDILLGADPLAPYEDPQAKAVKLVYPVYNSERLIAQNGIFTWHSHPKIALDTQAEQDFEDDKLDIKRLVKWPLEFGENRHKVLQTLENWGISQRTIFPDLTGIADGLWQTVVLFKGA